MTGIENPNGATQAPEDAIRRLYEWTVEEANMRLLTLHDILVAWQLGDIDYRRALRLAQIDTLDELYEAAHLNRVAIRTTLTSEEEAMANVVAELIRGQARLQAA